jgi:hypothetical protein
MGFWWDCYLRDSKIAYIIQWCHISSEVLVFIEQIHDLYHTLGPYKPLTEVILCLPTRDENMLSCRFTKDKSLRVVASFNMYRFEEDHYSQEF